MDTLSIAYAVSFNAAALILIAGVLWKMSIYARTPAPLKIPTTPAPTTRGGVIFRMFTELVFFASLFKSNKWTWLFGWLFHFGLLIVLLRHLRYFVAEPWLWLVWLQPFGKYASIAMVVGLAGLWLRRLAVDRVRYISSPSDHLMLLLLLSIGVTGMLMTFAEKVDIVALKAFFLGLLRLDWQPLPDDGLILFHLALVLVLMVIFPVSKLLHAPGVFFSPTLNQADNPREERWVGGYAGVRNRVWSIKSAAK